MSKVYYSRKRRRNRRRGRGKKMPLTKAQTRAVRAVAKKTVNSAIELKTLDYEYALSVASTPVFTDLTQIGQGTSDSTRIGIDIDVSSIYYNLKFILGDTTNFLRVVFFQWHDDRAAAPTYNDIFDYTLSMVPAYSELASPYAVRGGSTKSFTIIKDLQINVDAGNPSVVLRGFLTKKFTKKVQYGSASSLQGNNHIYMMYVSDSSAGPNPSMEGWIRLRFRDA